VLTKHTNDTKEKDLRSRTFVSFRCPPRRSLAEKGVFSGQTSLYSTYLRY